MSSANPEKNWQLNDSGILRKKEVHKEELLVFGYSCKLFRDDQRAQLIDQGKHLIPWMGDESLKIDRYDGRGALYDLSMYEPLPDGQDRWFGLSSEERYVEQMCDQERYRALTTNEDEEALYQEEELKRLQQTLDGEKAYGQVGFTYSEEKKEDEKSEAQKDEADDEDDTPFVAPHELDIPVNMIVPEKTKLNAIIERTAQFICEQGAQMEVLLKMKQASNPQFEFLSFGSPLHPYYRHVYMAIKTGRYRPQAQRQKAIEEKAKEDANSEHYLHPSLGTTSIELPEPAPVIPTINYKPSSDCAYSMLVNKIKEKQTHLTLSVLPPLLHKEPTLAPVSSPLRTAQQPPKIEPDEPVNPVAATSPVATSPVATVSNSTLRKRRKKARAEQALVDSQYYAPEEDEETCIEAPVSKPIETPPAHLQLVIDKMASYVAKNGIDFEAIVKSKADPRFSFLEETHEYHPYYRQKVNLYMKLNPQQLASEQSTDSNGVPSAAVQDTNSNLSNDENSQDSFSVNKPVPVCFSIKKPKETETLENRSALPVEESSEGEDSDDRTSNTSKSSRSNQEIIKKSEQAAHAAENNAKWIEERVKDKLSATAKEKLLAKEREKQIQQERKKRAAAFLNLLQKDRLVTSSQLKPAESTSQNDAAVADDVESLPSPSSVIAISDSDEPSNSESKNCNGSQVSHPLIDLSPPPAPKRHKRSPSPVYDHSKKKKRKHSSKSKKSHAKSSHKSSHRKADHRSSRHLKKHSRSDSRKHKKHSSKHKRHHEKKSKRKSSSSSSSSDSESSDSSSSS